MPTMRIGIGIIHLLSALKPSSMMMLGLFMLMLERLGVSADEAVFVDDRVKNINGAKKVGLRTVYYKDREKTIKELERILVV